MEVRSILVNVDIGTAEPPALRYAVDIAAKTGASLIGLAADQPNVAYAGWGSEAAVVDIFSLERAEIETQLRQAEEVFQTLVPATIKRQWRGYVTDRTRALIETSRLADLIVTSSSTGAAFQQRQATDLGALVLSTGRPVIDVAEGATQAKLDTICIGWKDTREARRAVADALPLLKLAGQVVALSVTEGNPAEEQISLDDLLAWLNSHGVTGRGELIRNPDSFADVLETNAMSLNADLLVIGGYGHSRVREWFFGGVTRSVLAANALNRLLSN